VAYERDEKKREAFREAIGVVHPNDLVFLDEAGFNLAMYFAYGWSISGERLVEAVPFGRGINYSVLGAFDLEGMVCTYQKEGSIKRVDVESFLQNDLLPLLKAGAVLVLDNARSHHGGRLLEIAESFGCSILYLPPYSPDFNPIELAWSWIKTFVRRLCPRDVESRLLAIESAIASLPQEFGKSWFRKTGVLC
jgi:transposase